MVTADLVRRIVLNLVPIILVALAGPLSNRLLAVISIAVLSVIARITPDMLFAQDGRGALVYLLRAMFVINVGSCMFNLLPLPPLDGSRLLPRSLDSVQEMIAPMSFLILLWILYSNTLRRYLIELPVGALSSTLESAFAVRVWGGPR